MAASSSPITKARGKNTEPPAEGTDPKKSQKKRGLTHKFKHFMSLSKKESKSATSSQSETKVTESADTNIQDSDPIQVSSSQIPTLTDHSQVTVPIITATRMVLFAKLLSTYTKILNENQNKSTEPPASPRYPMSPRFYLSEIVKDADYKLETLVLKMINQKYVLTLPQWMKKLQENPETLDAVSQFDESNLNESNLETLNAIYKSIDPEEQSKIDTLEIFKIPTQDPSTSSSESGEDASYDEESSSLSE
ncbi:MAG: hypothetical protein K2P51_07245 [Rhabdochlamydiaceae bacterium]|nr:hypothetical protein [Rhabdochlamydiaceae bacterium]